MWAWLGVLCVSVVCGLALDSNTIRSSKEAPQSSELTDPSHSSQESRSSTGSSSSSRSGSRSGSSNGSRSGSSNVSRSGSSNGSSSDRRAAAWCTGRDCNTPQGGGCSNRAQSRTSDTLMDPQRHSDRLNRTKGVEMASCVRSVDCSAGLCCARYLTGKRCQRIPQEGEVCLLRGPTKLRRNLGRCDCASGLACSAAATGSSSAGGKAQGVCVPRPRQAQRKTRHSGKKRRPAASELSC